MKQVVHNQCKVESEVGTLKQVVLHRPGRELERMLPEHLSRQLFEDIPWLRRMQEEHDGFAHTLTQEGVEVFYLKDLLQQVFSRRDVRQKFQGELLASGRNCDDRTATFLQEFLENQSVDSFVEFMISGISMEDLGGLKKELSLSDFIHDSHYFYINPVPNLYFMRDPAVVIGEGLALGTMFAPIRKRESEFMKLLWEHHPLLGKGTMNLCYTNQGPHTLEGGDVLVLSADALLVGCSQRTGVAGIELLVKNLFSKDSTIQHILVAQIPSMRAYMHLDTVLTMVDIDKCIVYPGVLEELSLSSVSRGANGAFEYRQEESLEKALSRYLKHSVELIPGGGDDPTVAAREQWNDGMNTLALAPGKVIAYNRNEVTNRLLRKRGVQVLEIEAGELVRGRGGPRCMSMPLKRLEQ